MEENDNRYIWNWNIKPISIYSLVGIALCWISLSAMGKMMPLLLRIMVCFICLYGGQNYEKINTFFKERCSSIGLKLVYVLVVIYTAHAFGGIYVLDDVNEFTAFYGTKVLFIIITVAWCSLFVKTIIWGITNSNTRPIIIKNYKLAFLLLFLFGVCSSLIWLYAFNPAITSIDSQGLFVQAFEVGTPEFTMNDWQPPMYVFIIAGLQRIWNNITFIVVLQILFFWFVISDAILYFYREGVSLSILGLSYLFFVIGYNNQIQLVTLWKDIPFSTAVVWLTVLLMKLYGNPETYKNKWYFYVELYVSLFCLAFLRQNGIIAVAVLIIALPLLFRTKGFTIVSMLLVITLLIVKGPVYRINNIVPSPSLKYYAMANDINYLYFHKIEIDEETKELAERMVEAEAGRKDMLPYNPYYTEYYHADLSDYSIPDFIRLYVKNFIQHPKEMVVAILRRWQIMLSIPKNDAEITNCINYIGETNTVHPEPYPKRIDNVFTRLLTKEKDLLKRSMTVYIFCWRPGIYNMLIVLSMATMLIGGNHRNNKKRWLPFIPIIFNNVALMISSCWTDYRYYWPSVLVCWCLVSYTCISLCHDKGEIYSGINNLNAMPK